MPHITVDEANAWADGSKLDLGVVDSELEASVATQVISQLSQAYDTSSWLSDTSTPALVRKLIAMIYVGWYFQRTYSEDEDTSNYGMLLVSQANKQIQGIVNGSIPIPDIPVGTDLQMSAPSFEPGELDCGPYFTMGTIW
jgi:hypothetical protein